MEKTARWAVGALLVGAMAFASCAKQQPAGQPGYSQPPGYGQEPKAPSSMEEAEQEGADEEAPTSVAQEPATLEEAERLLSESATVLQALREAGGEKRKREAALGGGEGSSELDDDDDGRCEKACKALASMRRATAAICRLAGDEDSRCLEAKEMLAGSEAWVEGCGCG